MSATKQYDVMVTIIDKDGERVYPGNKVKAIDLRVPVEVALAQGVIKLAATAATSKSKKGAS